MTTPFPSSGLYAITDSRRWPGENLLGAVEQAIAGGARVVQYREKSGGPDIAIVTKLLNICRSNRVPLIINDNVELAAQIHADGVHLGRDDLGIAAARERLGAGVILGRSCYDSIVNARQAALDGADYVALGSFFPSPTKPQAKAVAVERLKQLSLTIPVVAIGGITPDNGRELLQAGADLLAVISGIFSFAEPRQRAQLYRNLFADDEQA